MKKNYLFDWGDTLMIDFPDAHGKMCHWETVAAVSGAFDTIKALSKTANIYIATSAADSAELDIIKAFERVELNQFISGYFCKANLGYSKGEPEFLDAILKKLATDKANTFMVGDNLNKDILPALAAGIKAVWFKGNESQKPEPSVKVIQELIELVE